MPSKVYKSENLRTNRLFSQGREAVTTQKDLKNLGEIVVNHFLKTLHTTEGIIPKIKLSKQGELAFKVLINMINSLALQSESYKGTEKIKTNKIFQFIQENYKLPVLVVSRENNGTVNSKFECTFPLKFKNNPFFIDSPSKFNESGIYIFRHRSGKFALGSAMNFKRRLIDHINSFNEHRAMLRLHEFAKLNGGINSFTWGPLIITPNYYRLFLSLNPDYTLTKGEIQILVALTQFMPRVLEQAYLLHYKPELNGNKKKSYQIIFNILNWDSTSLKENILNNNNKINITNPTRSEFLEYRASDEDKNIVASSFSMNSLASLLGLSLPGLKYHLNRDSKVFAKSLGLNVQVYQTGIEPQGKPMDYYKSKKITREDLKLKNISLSDLKLGNIFVYNLDKETIVVEKSTSPLIFKYLNPNLSLKLDARNLKIQSDNMTTYINKESVYSSELGEFYLAKNPSYAINAKSPVILIEIESNLAHFCSSKRECSRILSKKLNMQIQLGTISRNNWIDSGQVIHDKFILITKFHLISRIPDLIDFNNGFLDLKPYGHNFIGYKYIPTTPPRLCLLRTPPEASEGGEAFLIFNKICYLPP